MTDVFKDFLVILVSVDGTRRRPLTPEDFRAAAGCPRTANLAACVERFNAKQAREGAGDRAHLELSRRRR